MIICKSCSWPENPVACISVGMPCSTGQLFAKTSMLCSTWCLTANWRQQVVLQKEQQAVPNLMTLFLFSMQLHFQEDLHITHMYSAEGEEIKLFKSIYPTGNVEDWLLEVEKMMKASVKDNIRRSLKTYPEVRIMWSIFIPYAYVKKRHFLQYYKYIYFSPNSI